MTNVLLNTEKWARIDRTTRHDMATTMSMLQELVVADIELFTDCSDAFLQNVLPLFDKVVYQPGEIIKTTGSVHQYVWIVESGGVKVVDGKGTVLHRNDVVGMHSLTPDASFCVYTAYAARQGAVCMRISRDSLNAMFTKYPQDQVLVMRNGLKYATRRPQADILVAMQMQVAKRGHPNRLSNLHKQTNSKSAPNMLKLSASTDADTKQVDSRKTQVTGDATVNLHPKHILTSSKRTHSKSVPNVLEFQDSTDARSTLENKRPREKSRASSITQTNPAVTLHKKHHNISSGALFYANVISQENSQSVPENGSMVEPSHMTIGHTHLVFWLMFALSLMLFPFERLLFPEPPF